MKAQVIIYSFAALVLIGCTQTNHKVNSATSDAIRVDSSFNSIQDSDYIAELVPIKQSVDSIMNQVIGTAPEDMNRDVPESNLMNWSANALLDIARTKTNHEVDAAVVNRGGLRCDVAKGDVTIRTIFSLMPFDNRLVIVAMEGKDVLDLCNTFAHRGGEGISGIRMQINGEKAENATIGGKPIVPEAIYYIATSDYLSTGTDEMVAFTRAIEKISTEEKIRDLYIEYVKDKGVMQADIDGRTTRIQ